MKHILLIDDDEDDHDFFSTVLKSINGKVKCEAAFNGAEALSLLEDMPALPGLIFLDLNMPVMNGKQFLTAIKKEDRLKNIPVIVLSTSSDEATISEATTLGAAEFITKPNKLSELEARLGKIFTNPTYYRELGQ